ncbi:MAG: hypothetical protein J6N54_01115 [Bacteroidales bacterium]|nr:hypothetical protein [Bacteroidales bacterium]
MIELNVPWKDYLAILDRRDEIERETEHTDHGDPVQHARWCALWDERHALDEKMEEMQKHVIPEVGATGTIKWYSDSSKAKVTKVISPKKIEVTACGLYHCTKIYTFRRNGHWIEEGSTTRDWSTLFYWGRGHDYYDMEY